MAENKEEKKGSKKILLFVILLVVIGLAAFAGFYIATSKSTEKEVIIQESYHEIGEMFVNLSEKSSYVKLNLTVAYDSKNKKLASEIEEKIVTLKDAAIFYLKSCEKEDFNASNEKSLKDNLKKRLNSKLKEGTILEIYISDIMVQ